ncbi:hypothetical protein SODALDRAFT_324529 [Sodiomyces alkalinus F11]|uniref:Myb-like domain-containing protein n=1 Tax=Sodiomyces alkalinus (strain CBS 110278 / VKM F-3762 / F11) TaxID=1314773 RepID=A0A3N2PUB4_SODAK|nr:hypothetical protein SODALDRAFT_324529 [Sodiomyces alkalinus F11]ROT38097.1 hypothetical protein SODALDRAFT_324529 [Sodiomyces alkalinus F11]
MAPNVQTAPQSATFTPTSDVVDRRAQGVTKLRKTATGGGRAWSEDEEAYLLRTRLQKMPYKHIAAHLKKTELACRLHYHQLSHGNNRRKQRAASVSSGSSAGQSPDTPASLPSPACESPPPSITPPRSAGHYGPPSPPAVQLPSIVSNGSSPHLPAILPKPVGMTLPPPIASPTRGYPSPIPERGAAPSPASFPGGQTHPTTSPLRLDCSFGQRHHSPSHHGAIDMGRLNAAYEAHRASFWATIANEYGGRASPATLEQAWKSGSCCHQSQQHQQHQHPPHQQVITPISPLSSPADSLEREGYSKPQTDRTRISAILGIDANPRSPRDREMVRRMEGGRSHV